LPTLHVVQGPDRGRTYETRDDAVVIGRSSEEFALSDDSSSRRHAEIRPENGSWVLADLHSSNGTFLNGERMVAPTVLKDGDQIRIGGTLLVFNSEFGPRSCGEPQVIRDLLDLDGSSVPGSSSILASVRRSDDSVILQAPETADAVAAWNVIYRIAETIGTAQSAAVFLERVADIVVAHLTTDHLVVFMCGEGPDELIPQVVRRRDASAPGRPKIPASRTIIKHVLDTRESVLCANAMTDDRFGNPENQDSIHSLGLRSVICVPIMANGQMDGLFYLDCSMSHHTYTQEQLRLVVAIGRLAGMAIQDARLRESRTRTERLVAVGEAAAYLSHHIRNILQGMAGGAEVVETGLNSENLEMARSGWTLVRRNVDRIYDLAVNMLTFSKDRQPRIETVQLNPIVEDAISLALNRANDKSVALVPNLGEIPSIPLSAEGMHQAVHNILINAIEASPSSTGRVVISTRYEPDAGLVRLSITDNGPGMESGDVARMFSPFESTKGHGGTGLGLTAAKKIVDELAGRIEVDSEVGMGTTFHIILPADPTRLTNNDDTPRPR